MDNDWDDPWLNGALPSFHREMLDPSRITVREDILYGAVRVGERGDTALREFDTLPITVSGLVALGHSLWEALRSAYGDPPEA